MWKGTFGELFYSLSYEGEDFTKIININYILIKSESASKELTVYFEQQQR
jgi:hypothetical protein